MFYSQTNNLRCSDESKKLNCSENWGYESCGQMKDAKYTNYGCKYLTAELSDLFECANRMDKSDILFDYPPVTRTERGQERTEDINMNNILIFDDENIYCGERNISYEELSYVVYLHRDEICQTKNDMQLTLQDIWRQLLTDFSFNMSSKIDEL